MADAGKIVITPKGAYSSTATYEWLDEVSYDGRAYIALKTVTGVTPSDDGENWRLFLDPADVNANTLVPTFEEQSARNNIISGDNISTLFGKVKKWFTDLKSHAFKDLVNNLTTEATGSALDASQGKVLQDEVEEINSNLLNQKMLGWTVPEEMPINNYVDSDGVFHQRVGRVDMSDLSWDFDSDKGKWATTSLNNIIKSSASDNTIMPNVYSRNQPIVKTANQVWGGEEGIGVGRTGDIYYKDSNTSSSNKPTGYLYFELATEITMNVDGNEAVTKVNESLDSQGLLNKFDGVFYQGFYDTNVTEGNPTQNNLTVTNKNHINVSDGDIINFKYIGKTTTFVFAQFYKNDGTNNGIVAIENGSKIDSIFTVPKNSKTMHINIQNSDGLTPNDVSSLYISVNNEIAELKNDLDKLNSLPKGTIIQIEADKDTIATTKEKYGWQYLGTSSIEYDNGSYVSMATNVYRKNN